MKVLQSFTQAPPRSIRGSCISFGWRCTVRGHMLDPRCQGMGGFGVWRVVTTGKCVVTTLRTLRFALPGVWM